VFAGGRGQACRAEVVWEHLGVQARFVIVGGCLGALIAGAAAAGAVPGAATARLVLVAVVAGVLVVGAGRRGFLALRWRIRPPAPRGGSTVLRRATLSAFGPEVRSGSIPDLIAGSTGDGRERDHHVLAWGGARSLDADSTAEAGSITKVLTGTLLAHLCLTGAVRLDSDVSALLGLPQLRGITLADLATHRSGLPRLADGALWYGLVHPDPYRGFDVDRLLARLPERAAGRPTYSNLGFALLGLALARAAGIEYADLMQEAIIEPLGLTASGFDGNPDMRGHDRFGLPVRPWRFAAFAPAGGLRTSLADLLRLADAVIAAPDGPLGPAIELAITARAPYGTGSVGLGWHINNGLTWHNGGTNGTWAWIGIDRAAQRGGAVLVSRPPRRSLDDAAARWLRGGQAGDSPE
jgi:CubicO group peptidase (beta-lactamase class C family)